MSYTIVKVSAPCSIVFKPTSDRLTAYLSGSVYHSRDTDGLNQLCINFPIVGTYKVNGVELRRGPLKRFNLRMRLPAKERNFTRPAKMKIVQHSSEHLACVIKETGTIYVNDRFMRLPIQVQDFILNHELGHYDYTTEHFCDLYALKKFVDKGFNPSQAFVALNEHLRPSRDNEKRVLELLNVIKRMYE